MGKVTKKVLFGLIIIALALPMFVGCEPDTPAEPPATDYKALFLSELKTEVDASNVATLTYAGEDLTVTFSNSDPSTVHGEATTLVNTFSNKIRTDSELVLGDTTFKFDNTLVLKDVKDKILELTSDIYNASFDYEVHIKNYKGQNFTLSGEVTINGVTL